MKKIIREYHEGQYRNYREGFIPAKVPYDDHLFGVKSILSFALNRFGECQDKQIEGDMLNAALGHDLLEDTDVSEEEILAHTNSRVLSLIKELTNPIDDSHTDQYLQQLRTASEEARLIKYADLIENTTCVCHNIHTLGDEWYMTMYRPILFGTMGVLEETEFPNYPRTAEFLRDTLDMFAHLLYEKHISFQYPVKAIQVMREAIPDSDLDAHIEESYACFRVRCKHYRAGMLTTDERRDLFLREFHRGFYDYIESKRVRTRFNDGSYARFLEDYDLWCDGKQPCSSSGSAWLIYYDSEEASALDKNSFFKLMKAYSIPTSYFKPIPGSCVEPKLHFHNDGAGMAGTIRFDLTDDGGLYTCDDPIGKEFILTDEYGLKAVIFIERAGKKDEIHNIMSPQYVGRGTIEGYTSSREREIFISEREDNIVYFWIRFGNDDCDVLHSFPLWDSYNAFVDDFNRRSLEHIQGLIHNFDEP